MKYVFTGYESIDSYHRNIFESDLDIDAIRQLLAPIVNHTVCEKYIRMDNDTFIYTNGYIGNFRVETFDEFIRTMTYKPDHTELGTHSGIYGTYTIVDLTSGLEYEASKTFIKLG